MHKSIFENILSVALADRFYDPTDKIYPKLFGTDSETREQARLSDTGRMISLLMGDPDAGTPGFQLPPEFDFINNAAVDPFQMIIVPFDHELDKQDLVNIYQGIMPDISIRASKAIKEVTINPRSDITNEFIMPSVLVKQTETQGSSVLIQSLEAPQRISMTGLNLASFLSPKATLPGAVSSLFGGNLPAGLAATHGFDSSKDFYKNLNFMVFKIKQKGISDYDLYRKRSISQAVNQKIVLPSGEDLSYKFQEISRNVKAKEVYGSNWPYDFFSLVEAAKVDIEIEVDG